MNSFSLSFPFYRSPDFRKYKGKERRGKEHKLSGTLQVVRSSRLKSESAEVVPLTGADSGA